MDNLNVYVDYESEDEIGSLISVYNKMVERINYLVNVILDNKINLQEYELKVLQAQINPHFLYNSLSMINSRAILAGEFEISQMTQLLSAYYRSTLNEGKDFTSLKSELENTLSYVKIQRMLHNNSFELVVELSDALDNLDSIMVPHLIIQPIAENAINHGLDNKTSPGPQVLTINTYLENQDIIIQVMDNGQGICPDKLENILNEESSNGFGLKNVNQRLITLYGSDYALDIDSSIGLGTSVKVKIPLHAANLEKFA